MAVNGKALCNECVKVALQRDNGEVDVPYRTHGKVYRLMYQLRDANRNIAPTLIMEVWQCITVEEVTVNRGKNENYYRIKLPDGDIILNEQECLLCTKFRTEYQRIYGILLPNLPQVKWACLMTEWLMRRKQGEDVEEVSEHQEIVDAIIEHITSARLIRGVGAPTFGTVYHADDAILVPNDTIRTIATRINRTLQMRKVSSIVSSYLVGSTKTYRTTSGMVRMWRFDPAKVGVNTENALDLEVGEDTDE
jgi:hypothetical protein